MATYLAKFCPNFRSVTAPIAALLQKFSEFRWRPDPRGVACNNFEAMFVNAPVLAFFDGFKPITVQCDSSQAGIGAILLQDGKPVEKASRATTRTEQNYAQIEKKQLAIVFAMEYFHTNVYAQHVTVVTGHKPLIAVYKKALSSAPKRLQNMLLLRLRRAYPSLDLSGKHTGAEFEEELAALMDDQQLQE